MENGELTLEQKILQQQVEIDSAIKTVKETGTPEVWNALRDAIFIIIEQYYHYSFINDESIMDRLESFVHNLSNYDYGNYNQALFDTEFGKLTTNMQIGFLSQIKQIIKYHTDPGIDFMLIENRIKSYKNEIAASLWLIVKKSPEYERDYIFATITARLFIFIEQSPNPHFYSYYFKGLLRNLEHLIFLNPKAEIFDIVFDRLDTQSKLSLLSDIRGIVNRYLGRPAD